VGHDIELRAGTKFQLARVENEVRKMDNPAPESTLDLVNRLDRTAGALADGRALSLNERERVARIIQDLVRVATRLTETGFRKDRR
jgi:hypothetical protein